jgi:uncharacterized membrane protein
VVGCLSAINTPTMRQVWPRGTYGIIFFYLTGQFAVGGIIGGRLSNHGGAVGGGSSEGGSSSSSASDKRRRRCRNVKSLSDVGKK